MAISAFRNRREIRVGFRIRRFGQKIPQTSLDAARALP